MKTIYVFTEEPSATIVVEHLAKMYAPLADVKVVSHSGKSDLLNSFPRKMKAIQHPADAGFIVLHDNDGAICTDLKRRLLQLVPQNVLLRSKIRLVMQELEGWYLGQPDALVKSQLITSTQAARLNGKAAFRDPDRLTNAKQEFYKLHSLKDQQRKLARMIAPHLDVETNRSGSFRLFVSTIKEFAL